jgi:putative ABC transport system ATP-binding protein
MAVLIESMTKTYGIGASTITAIDDVSLSFPVGSFTAVMGPSGSGKSTLLQCAAGLDRPNSGKVSIGGTELSGLGETTLTRLRRDQVGFVFQSFNLMPSLTAAQNVELPLRLAGRKADPNAIQTVLARVGLADRARHRPSELSGGQQQRVAIARALVTSPVSRSRCCRCWWQPCAPGRSGPPRRCARPPSNRSGSAGSGCWAASSRCPAESPHSPS